ncbi:MAG: phosphotransferase [Jatrophihabitans sp.]
MIHSDLTPNNVLLSRGRLAAIDFQDMTWGHVEQDLANSIFGITRGVAVEDCTRAFRSSEQIRPWPNLPKSCYGPLRRAPTRDGEPGVFMNRAGLVDYLEHHAVALRAYLQ